jgi:hypothetical protein
VLVQCIVLLLRSRKGGSAFPPEPLNLIGVPPARSPAMVLLREEDFGAGLPS